jgi:hypothetical protein
MNRNFLALICALILFVIPGSTICQWSPDPTVNTPVAVGPAPQWWPSIVDDGAGGAIIAWTEGVFNVDADIRAQRIDASGKAMWTAGGVSVSAAAGDQFYPLIVSDGNGGAIIAWTDRRNGANYDVYAQRVNASGVILWAADGAAVCTTAGNQSNQDIVADGAGGAVIGWRDSRSGVSADIYAQRINSTGTPMWGTNGLAVCAEAGAQQYPALLADATGGAFFVWDDRRSGLDFDIYTQWIDGTGTARGPAGGFAVCTASSDQINCKLISDGFGGGIVTWWDRRNGTNYDIYAQRLDTFGVAHWGVNGLPICTAAGDQWLCGAVISAPGYYMFLWIDDRLGPDDEVYAQKVSAAGAVQWAANGVLVCGVAGYQENATITSDGSGGAIAAWEDYRSLSHYDIYSQRIDSSGSMVWPSDGIPVATASGDQRNPKIVGDRAGGFIAAWQDARTDSVSDIYATAISKNGVAGGYAPMQLDVADVPGDQGGQVTLSWEASILDVSPETMVTHYSVWRGVVPGARAGANAAGGVNRNRAVNGASAGIAWERVADVPAAYLAHYQYVAATLSDSGPGGASWTSFFVSSGTSDTSLLWKSAVDSASSVDNLPPGTVPWIEGEAAAGPIVTLHWGPNGSDTDVVSYDVHRSVSSGFPPSPGTKIGSAGDTAFVDGSPTPGVVNYYRVVAIDAHGNAGGPSAEAAVATAVVVECGILKNWNLVSVPMSVADYSKAGLFPNATTNAYLYQDGYVTSPTLANGAGYWLKFPEAETVPMSGVPRTEESIPVADGWNIVGSISAPVGVASVTSTPPGMVTSNFFGYDNGYQVSTIIEPGKGYWVKVAGSGSLHLSSESADGKNSGADASNRVRIEPGGEMPPPPPGETPAGDLPGEFSLGQNYPNPFNPVTEIRYALPEEGHVKLEVFNMLGERVRVLADGMEAAGWNTVRFDGAGLPSGVYTCRLEANGFTQARRMLLVR